ncbi:MAG: DUF4912 domain-containing protein [Clostridia bacterium]|nr:DUF4912 domain-containing protein [Clostridia bacterium]
MPKATKEINKKKSKNSNSNVMSDTGIKKKEKSKTAVSSNSKKVKTTTKPKNSKTTSAKKVPSKKTTAKKSSKEIPSKPKQINSLEYYDLPYRYNKTLVKILAQTPKTLFVYWDISDEDKSYYIKQYGKNFFEDTTPILIVHNTTMNYTFEIEINDFANCWYFNINDEKCEYLVELGRKVKKNNYIIPNNYLYITSSNKIESPNGHILFEKEQKALYYRNVKTNETYSKDIANIGFIKYFGRIYNAYKKIYKEDEILNIKNPTSKFN